MKKLNPNFATPKHVLRMAISNEDALKVIDRVCRMKPEDPLKEFNKNKKLWVPPLYPGLSYTIDTVQAKLLLATPNGKGVAWLLIQHKKDFGVLEVKKVTLFRAAHDASAMMLFHIGKV